jgi:hypothetical protein
MASRHVDHAAGVRTELDRLAAGDEAQVLYEPGRQYVDELSGEPLRERDPINDVEHAHLGATDVQDPVGAERVGREAGLREDDLSERLCVAAGEGLHVAAR